MAIQFECPSCNKRLSVDESLAGRRARCKCGEAVTVPERSGATTSAAVASAAVGSTASSKPANGGTASGANSTAMVPAVSKISVTCSACSKKYQVDAKHAGRSMKCQCGQSLVAASPKQTALAKQGAMAAASAMATPANRNSLLDELTDDDWGPKATPVPVSDRAKVTDGEYLRAYVAKSPDFFDSQDAQAVHVPGGISFLVGLNSFFGVMSLLGGMFQLIGGGEEALVAGISSVVSALVYIGLAALMMLRQRWVWWFTCLQAHFSALIGVIAFIMMVGIAMAARPDPEGWGGLLIAGALLMLFIFAGVGVGWAVYYWMDDVREYYKVKFHRGYSALIVAGVVLGLPGLLLASLFILGAILR